MLLAGCGNDEDPAPSGSASSGASETATTQATDEPTTEPSTVETTPAIEPATGLKLKQNYAEISMPEGWERKNNFGVPFLRQGASSELFGSLTFSELNSGGTDTGATSLDAIAKRQLRLVEDAEIKRVEDAVLGGETQAYRLAGQVDQYYYEEYYGALIGNIEYSLQFSFNTRFGTIDEAIETINSMLATWDFNP